MIGRLSVRAVARGDDPRCIRCGRRVYSWLSIASGYGHKCRAHLAAQRAYVPPRRG